MTAINAQWNFIVGPYKEFCGKGTFDPEADVFHGEVVGTRDVITFQGETPGQAIEAFKESIDDYLEFCASRNETPEKPFSGKFVTRMHPTLHRKLSVLADASGKSLNQFICDRLEEAARSAPDAPPPGPPEAPSKRPRRRGATAARAARPAKKETKSPARTGRRRQTA